MAEQNNVERALHNLRLLSESSNLYEEFEVLTGQMIPISENQVLNNAGGYVYQVSDLTRIRRFLILGTTGGTYYVSHSELTDAMHEELVQIICKGNGDLLIREIAEITSSNRAPKRDQAIFATALCARYQLKDWGVKKNNNDMDVYFKNLQTAAFNLLPIICRTPTDLFLFLKYAETISMRYAKTTGWGRMMRKCIEQWYIRKTPQHLAMQITKYRSRNGYTHRDALRLSHASPKAADTDLVAIYDYLFHYIVSGNLNEAYGTLNEESQNRLKQIGIHQLLEAVEMVSKFGEDDGEKCAELIRSTGLVREHIPTLLLNSPAVWKALLEKMPMTAMVRNLAKLSTLRLITGEQMENQSYVDKVVQELRNEQRLKASGIHPISLMLARSVMLSGEGVRGSLKFKTNPIILNALDDAFLLAFNNVKPTGKRFCLALDVSGSMSCHASGTVLPCYDAEVALSMVTVQTEPHTEVVAFCDVLTPLNIGNQTNFNEALKMVKNLDFGATDCALPIVWAKQQKKEFDVFIVYTDSETYFGEVHPSRALRDYREEMGIKDARLIVVAFTATEFTIADPSDPLMLDVCGFDSSLPEVMSAFINGEI